MRLIFLVILLMIVVFSGIFAVIGMRQEWLFLKAFGVVAGMVFVFGSSLLSVHLYFEFSSYERESAEKLLFQTLLTALALPFIYVIGNKALKMSPFIFHDSIYPDYFLLAAFSFCALYSIWTPEHATNEKTSILPAWLENANEETKAWAIFIGMVGGAVVFLGLHFLFGFYGLYFYLPTALAVYFTAALAIGFAFYKSVENETTRLREVKYRLEAHELWRHMTESQRELVERERKSRECTS